MNVDLGLLEWAIGGVMTLAAMVCGYLYRELKEADRCTDLSLTEFKLHVTGTYAPRNEVKEATNDLKREIRENTQDIKDFIDAKMR